MATRDNWLACCVRAHGSVPQPPSRRRPPGTRPIRSLRLRHPTRWHLGLVAVTTRPIRPRRQLVNVLLPVLEPAEPTVPPLTLSRVLSDRRLGSATVAPSSPPGCPGRSGHVSPSLKEPRKVTTYRLLCQVSRRRSRQTFALPHRRGCQRQDCKYYHPANAMSSRARWPLAQASREFSQYPGAPSAPVVPLN